MSCCIHHMHIWGMSTNEDALTCHVLVDKLKNISAIKQNIKEELKANNIKYSSLEFKTAEEDWNNITKNKVD